MRSLICGSVLNVIAAVVAALAADIPPPPPLIDYAEASYTGLSYVAVCAPARTYVFVISSPFGSGPRIQSLTVYGVQATPEELAAANERLGALKSFASLRIYCATGQDMVRISGYPKTPDGYRLSDVVLHFPGGRVVAD